MADDVSASLDQGGVDDLVAQLQAQVGAGDAAQATDAIRQASATASEIAAEIHKTDASPDSTIAPAGLEPPAPPPETAAPPARSVEPASICPELKRLLAIDVPIIVQLGIRRLSVGEVMRFAVGAIIEFQKSAEEELELLANNRPIGKGHAVKVGENFGLRITAITSVRETIRALGAN